MKHVKAMLASFLAWLNTPAVDLSAGLLTPSALKLPIILVTYLMSIGFMASDPWFGKDSFSWNQGVFVILVSYVIVTTIAFEWNLLGRSRGFNLLLQFLLIAPFSIMFGRIVSRPTDPEAAKGLLGEAIYTVKDFLSMATGVKDIIPGWMLEPFATPGTAIFMVLVCVALSYGTIRTRVGMLVLVITISFVSTIGSDAPPSFQFYWGLGFLILGVALHIHNVNATVQQEQALKRLRDVDDELERKCSLRILCKVLEDGRMNEKGAFETVRRHYQGHAQSAEEIALCARSIINRLVNEHGVLAIRGSAEGSFLVPSSGLSVQESIFSQLGSWPRCVLLGFLAFVWLILPLDAIPDSVPFVGLLDDAAIVLLGASPLAQKVMQTLRPKTVSET
ncbi:MAG: YkvA family protein [Planctomycetota bacterium]|nr:YkvA family protein [Planctomycetota bacterium]MDA1141958.1 YkvA family protein [Planctomycetota bacterium]